MERVAVIKEIWFDPGSFPIPINHTNSEIAVVDDINMLMTVECNRDDLNSHIAVLQEHEVAILPNQPAGEYSLFVELEGRPTDPHIVFNFTQNANVIDAVRLSFVDYGQKTMEEIGSRFPGRQITPYDKVLLAVAKRFHMEYLENIFSEKLQGNENFWSRFEQALNACLLHTSLVRMLALQGYSGEVRVEYKKPKQASAGPELNA